MKPPPFEYVAARDLDEAVATLAEHGDEAKLLAGGQSLMPMLAFRLARPSVLVDMNRLSELSEAAIDGDVLRVGAMARQRDIEHLPGLRERCPMIVEAIEQIGHVPIRNRGTVGGSLAHADPTAEWTALALALDAELDVVGPSGSRTLAANDFFITYYTTALAADEVLTQVRLTLPNGRSGSRFLELTRRHGDFALVGVAALISLDDNDAIADARVALMGVDDRAVRASAVEAALRGRDPSDGLLAEAAERTDEAVGSRSDVHASASYRRQVARVLTRRALVTALARARGGEDVDGKA